MLILLLIPWLLVIPRRTDFLSVFLLFLPFAILVPNCTVRISVQNWSCVTSD